MSNQIWSWVVTIIGVIGFWLAGRKVWWCWYVNVANQILWVIFAVVTRQWGFLVGVPLYLTVFGRNAVVWTRERREFIHTQTTPSTMRRRMWRWLSHRKHRAR